MPQQIAPTPGTRHAATFLIEIKGAKASDAFYENLVEFQIERTLHLPDLCALRVQDLDFAWLDNELLTEGNALKINATVEGADAGLLFDGEIVGLEMDMAAGGVPTTTIRGMDRSHRLHRGRHQRSFQNVTDSDLVKKIGSEAGFTVQAQTPTPQVHDWVMQNNQTNWEFLHACAARSGYRLYATADKKLIFEPVKDNDGGGSFVLQWSGNLRSFRPRTSASPQVSEVEVRGWDPKTKKAILGKAGVARSLPTTNAKPGGHTLGKAKMVVTNRPVATQAQAEAIAQSLLDQIAGSYLEADGLCEGEPRLVPGVWADVRGVGRRFSGKYKVTTVTHNWGQPDGFTTLFGCGGKGEDGILTILQSGGGGGGGAGSGGGSGDTGGAGAAALANSAPGGNLVTAIVTAVLDPLNQGRVKVMYPWLSGADQSFWARIVSPMAGKNRGFLFLPEVDDEVLVAFEQGDITRPYLLGALWNGKDAPPDTNANAFTSGKVQRRTLMSRIGHTLLLDDTGDKGEISLTTLAKNIVILNDKEEHIAALTTKGHSLILDDKNKCIVAATTKGHTVLLDDGGDKVVVTDKNGNKITIKSTDNSMSLECKGNFSVDAKGNVSIKAGGNANIKAMQVDVSANTNVSVSALMNLNLKATMAASLEGTIKTDIKSGLACDIAAPMVKINS